MLLDLRSRWESSVVASETITLLDRSRVEIGTPIIVTDDFTVRVTVYLPASETVTLEDAVTAILGQVIVAASDAVSITEATPVEIPIGGLAPSVTEDVTVTEVGIAGLSTFVTVSDLLGVNEALAASLLVFATVSEDVALTESALAPPLIPPFATETVTLTESVALLIAILGDLSASVSEDVTVSEQAPVRLTGLGRRRLLPVLGVGA